MSLERALRAAMEGRQTGDPVRDAIAAALRGRDPEPDATAPDTTTTTEAVALNSPALELGLEGALNKETHP